MLPSQAPTPARFRGIPLRLKLTLWMVLLFLVVQLSLGLVFKLFEQRSINELFDARIRRAVHLIAHDLAPQLPDVSAADLVDRADAYRGILFPHCVLIQVFDENGRSVASSRTPAEPLSPEVWKSIANESGPVSTRLPISLSAVPGDGPARAAAEWITTPSGTRFLLLAGWGDLYAQEILRLVAHALFLSIPIGIVAVAISAYVISGVAVRPIQAMRHMARALEPEFLRDRVEIGGMGPEVAELQQSLERTRLKLETAFQAQERFMSNVSHELKTPIAVLSTEAQTLKLDNAPKEVRAFVGSVLEELFKLGRMVDSFLLLTRVRHGKATVPDRQSCLARDFMVESAEGCASMASQYGVRLSVTLPDEQHLDAAVFGNSDLLRTVLDNLIRNAIRFSPKGQLVELIGHVDGDRLLIRVRDRGPGIPNSLLSRIFDRFAQSPDEQRRGRGHGLGLEIALGIAELHGGTISAANHPDGGCEFTLSLPVLAAYAPQTPTAIAM